MKRWGSVVAGVLVLTALIGCGHGSQPSISATADSQSEAIITQWETEFVRLTRQGCTFRGSYLVCGW